MIGFAVTGVLLWWTFHKADPAEILGHIRRADGLLLFAAVVAATLTFPLRTVRWRVMVRGTDGRPLPFRALWHAVTIGFMANNLLPARAGEFTRAYVASRQTDLRFATALASIGVERVFDALVMVGLLFLGILAPSFPRAAQVGGVSVTRIAAGLAVVFGTVLVVAVLVVRRPEPWLRLFSRMAHAVLPERFAQRLMQFADGVVHGLAVLKDPRRFAGVLGWSLVLWLVNAASFWLAFLAFDLPVPIEGALVLQGFIGFGVAVPSSPGYLGVFEAITLVTLAFYGVGANLAAGYAVAYHVTTFIPITVIGLHSLSRAHVRLGELREGS